MAVPEVEEVGADREDVADLGVDVEEEAEGDFDQFANGKHARFKEQRRLLLSLYSPWAVEHGTDGF